MHPSEVTFGGGVEQSDPVLVRGSMHHSHQNAVQERGAPGGHVKAVK